MTDVDVAVRPAIRLAVRHTDGLEYAMTLDGGKDRYLIGRRDERMNAGIDVAVDDKFVSRRQCEFLWEDGLRRWGVRDLNSSNGTLVEEELVYHDRVRALFDGARIKVGATMITVSFGPPAAGPPSTRPDDGEDDALGGATVLNPGGLVLDFGPDDGKTRILDAGSDEARRLLLGPGDGPDLGEATIIGGPMMAGATVLSSHPTDLGATIIGSPGMLDATVKRGEAMPTGAMPSRLPTEVGPTAPIARTAPTVPAAPIAPTAPAAPTAPTGLGGTATREQPSWAKAPWSRSQSTEPPPDTSGTAPRERATTLPPQPEPRVTAKPAGGAAMAGPSSVIEFGGIAQEIVDANLLDAQKAVSLGRVARETGRTFFRVLAHDTTIRYVDKIYEKVAERLGLEFIDKEAQIQEFANEADWLPFTPATMNLGVVNLVTKEEDTVLYATIDPFDVPVEDWIARASGKKPRKVLVTPSAYHSAMQRLIIRPDPEVGANALVIDIGSELERRIHTRVEDVEVPQIVNYFLQKAHTEGASDIHVEPTEEFLLVRNRVDGILHDNIALPGVLQPEISSRLKILSGMDVAEKRRPQDGRIATIIRNQAIDIRVSSYPTIYGEKVVMRLLDRNKLQPTPTKLGLLPRDLRLLFDKIEAPFGLIMISGPTGSGKTTTLYSCLSHIDKRTKNVMTVEDPVEYRLAGVHQMQVNDKIGLTFSSGLRTILRQDPDVIMVGECRDMETAQMAIQASLTGHIVFSTIHTNDAVGVVTRLLDMGIDAFLVATAVTLAIAQRLVRCICPHCQADVDGAEVMSRLHNDGVSDERLQALGIEIDPNLGYQVGMGCMHCRNTGYRGRRAVLEVFEMTREARNMILAPSFNADELRRMAHAGGMTTLIRHGLMLVEEGITTHSEVIRVLGESY